MKCARGEELYSMEGSAAVSEVTVERDRGHLGQDAAAHAPAHEIGRLKAESYHCRRLDLDWNTAAFVRFVPPLPNCFNRSIIQKL